MQKKKIFEIILLFMIVVIYGWIFFQYLAMLPNPSDPLQYIEPSVEKSLVDIFPWFDRLVVADSIRFLSLFIKKLEIAGAAYFGIINFLILICVIIWSYLKRGFWTAFLAGFFLIISYPLLRYANYGYPDATVALYTVLALAFYLHGLKSSQRGILLAGLFTILAIFSKITGLAVLLFFVIDLLRAKEYQKLKTYFYGLVLGIILVFLATLLLFNFESIKFVFAKIFYNISSNTEPRPIGQSILTIFSPEIFLPGYLALLVFWKAYKNFEIRKIFLLSITFIVVFSLLVVLSSHVKVYPHYLYTAYILVSVGMSWYLASLWPKVTKKEQKFLFIYALAALILAALGMYLGINNASYLVSVLKAPLILKIFYIAYSLIIGALLIGIGYFRSKKMVIVFLLIMAFFGSFYTSGSVYRILSKHKENVNVIYNLARALNQMPNQDINIYSDVSYPELGRRIFWVYRLFFENDKSSRVVKEEDVEVLTKEEIVTNKWQYLLTEKPIIIQQISPQAEIIEKIGSADQIYILRK